jgi:hypothetical protein
MKFSSWQIAPAMIQAVRGNQMGAVSSIVKQLKKERDRVQRQLSGLNAALSAFTGVYSGKAKQARPTLSAAAREKISVAQKARWAKKKSSSQTARPKRTVSATARKRMAAAQSARWAKIRAKKG